MASTFPIVIRIRVTTAADSGKLTFGKMTQRKSRDDMPIPKKLALSIDPITMYYLPILP